MDKPTPNLARDEQVDPGLLAVRKRFEDQLAVLNEPGVAERLEAAFKNGADLEGKVIAGETY